MQNQNATENYSYFPIILESEKQLKQVEIALNSQQIFPRRYFYPSLDTLSYIEPKQYCQHSRDIANRILCLPVFAELTTKEQGTIIGIIKQTLGMN
jgi:dTDP-4-amino-4,6-dideoxygalactose transaminase